MKKIVISILILFTFISCNSADVSTSKTDDAQKEEVIPDGEFIKKHPNGKIQIEGQLLNNERIGLWTAYYENGVKQSESTYQNGVLHGRTASFYTNGQVRYIGYFSGGKKDSKWEFYSEEGVFNKSETFVKGKLSN